MVPESAKQVQMRLLVNSFLMRLSKNIAVSRLGWLVFVAKDLNT
jgi:hypothetical protein